MSLITDAAASFPSLVEISSSKAEVRDGAQVISVSTSIHSDPPSTESATQLSQSEAMAVKSLVSFDPSAERKGEVKSPLTSNPIDLFYWQRELVSPEKLRLRLKTFEYDELMAILAFRKIDTKTLFLQPPFENFLVAEKMKDQRSVNRDLKYKSIRDPKEESHTEMMIACMDETNYVSSLIKVSLVSSLKKENLVASHCKNMAKFEGAWAQIFALPRGAYFLSAVITMLLVKASGVPRLDKNNNVMEADEATKEMIEMNLRSFLAKHGLVMKF